MWVQGTPRGKAGATIPEEEMNPVTECSPAQVDENANPTLHSTPLPKGVRQPATTEASSAFHARYVGLEVL